MDFSVRKAGGKYPFDTANKSGFPKLHPFEEIPALDTGKARRKVHCFRSSETEAAGFNTAIQAEAPKRGPSLPMAIPGSDSSQDLSLIKAFPAIKKPFQGRLQMEPIDHSKYTSAQEFPPPPVGSWTERQLRFDPTDPSTRVVGKTDLLREGKNGVIRGSKATKPAPREPTEEKLNADNAAWRYCFKKKWIREEIHAKRQEFPDDPEYDDPWEDAGDFIVRNGYKTALQAAFMGASRGGHQAVEVTDENESFASEDLSFDSAFDEQDSQGGLDGQAKMLSRAATLVQLTQKAKLGKAVG